MRKFLAPLPSRRPKRAFTLVELLVVIAIIGTLVGLLLPAVQSARESARRTSCSNGFKQLGIAINSYHDSKGKLPSAIRPDPASTVRVGVLTFILPWVEQQRLFDAYDQSVNWSDPINLPVTSIRVPFYECASSPKHSNQLDQNPDGVTGFGTGIVAVGDYASNLGVAPGLAAAVTGNVTIGGSSVAKSTLIQESVAWTSGTGGLTNGFLPKNASLTLSDISDGVSNTIAMFESGGRPFVYNKGQQKSASLNTAHTNGGGWARPASDILFAGSNAAGTSLFGPYFNKTNGHDHASDAYGTKGYPSPAGSGTEGTSQPYSFHPGGMNVLIGDGAVRFINDETAIEVLSALITRNEAAGEIKVTVGSAK
jgi:prepilin-type N-terminal cleavage/methylation domain-containing protein